MIDDKWKIIQFDFFFLQKFTKTIKNARNF
jgi:hypothetical protein